MLPASVVRARFSRHPFFPLSSLCFDTSLDSRDFLKSSLIIIISIFSVIEEISNALDAIIFLKVILSFMVFFGEMEKVN